jgi:hypothetical protein
MCAERGRSGGFTLVEALGATVITFTIVAAAIQSAIGAGSGTELIRSSLFVRTDDALRRISDDLERADLDPLPGGGDRVAFELPIDADGNGSFYDAHDALEWGAVVNGKAVLGARTAFQFATDSTVDEATLGCDLNGDGDRLDRFDVGHLERVKPDGSVEPLTGATILQPAGNHGGDLDGDGVADPLFAVDTAGAKSIVTVDLFAATKRSERDWILLRQRKTLLAANDVH